jgi:hypothetical protein
MYYAELILGLDDHVLYTAGTIAAIGFERQLSFPKARNPSRVNLRHSLCLLARTGVFPREGDGLVHLPGLAVSPAWYGWRWKAAVRQTPLRRQPRGQRAPEETNNQEESAHATLQPSSANAGG